MKFGCCTKIDNISILEQAGYDYVEILIILVFLEKNYQGYFSLEYEAKEDSKIGIILREDSCS